MGLLNGTGQERLAGVDLARFLALVGMFGGHTLPTLTGDGGTAWYAPLVSGRPSALFALLGGVSLVLAAQGHLHDGDVRGARGATALRAVLIAALGLLLATPQPMVGVILTVYGLLWLIVLPVLTARPAVLLAISGAWTLLAPPLSLALRTHVIPQDWNFFWNPSFLTLLYDPVGSLGSTLLYGMYPVLTWVPYVLVGLAVGDLVTRARGAGRAALRRTAAGAGAAGAAAALAGWGVSRLVLARDDIAALAPSVDGGAAAVRRTAAEGFHGVSPVGEPVWLLIAAPHSGSITDIIVTAGAAVATVGGCLLLADLLSRSAVGAAVREVPARAGAMTLTLYSAHVLVMSVPLTLLAVLQTGAPAFLAWAAIAVLAGAAAAARDRRGPLEKALSRVVALVVPRQRAEPPG